jgi:hypothetical protein
VACFEPDFACGSMVLYRVRFPFLRSEAQKGKRRNAVLYLLFVFRFCARRAQKRNTDIMASTMLPQAKRHLRAAAHTASTGMF